MPEGGADATARVQFDFDQRTAALAGSLENVTLRHGDERLALRQVAVAGVASGAQGLSVDSVTVHGPELDLARLADGTLAVAGLRLRPPAPAAPPPPPRPPRPPLPGPSPGFLLRRLTWRDASVRFRDATVPGNPAQNIAQITVDAENLGLGSLATTGHALATLRLPSSVESVRLRGRHATPPRRHRRRPALRSEWPQRQGLGPWLQAAGCQPEWRAADLSLAASVEVGFRPDLTLAGRIANVRLQEGNQVLLGLRNLELTGFRLPAELDDPGDPARRAAHRRTPPARAARDGRRAVVRRDAVRSWQLVAARGEQCSTTDDRPALAGGQGRAAGRARVPANGARPPPPWLSGPMPNSARTAPTARPPPSRARCASTRRSTRSNCAAPSRPALAACSATRRSTAAACAAAGSRRWPRASSPP